MKRFCGLFLLLSLMVCVSGRAKAQFSAQIYQETGSYTAQLSGDAWCYNGGSQMTTLTGPIIFGWQTGTYPAYGGKASFGFGAKTLITVNKSGNAQMGGTAYITWKIIGPTSQSPYDVVVTMNSKCTYDCEADALKNGENTYGHATGPFGQGNAVASGPNGYSQDGNSSFQPLYHTVTLGTDGIGYVTVPFIGQAVSQSYGPSYDRTAIGWGSFSFYVEIMDIH